jgi:hypothetical protein
MPRFVAASPPDISRTDEGEKFHLLRTQRVQPSGVVSELTPRPVETRTIGSVTSHTSTEIFGTSENGRSNVVMLP